MIKSPDAFRTISEVAEALDVPPHVLRFWETRFAQVKPVKRGGGRRYYRPEDVRLLRGIRGLLYDDGMTIKGVQKILRERGIRHVIGLGTLPEAGAVAPPAPARAAAKTAARAGNGRPAARPPQPDLFEAPPPAPGAAPPGRPAAARPAAARPGGPGGPLDKAALRSLLQELQALRQVMIADP
jgi:DNA-binding transcriptional MerR regulator